MLVYLDNEFKCHVNKNNESDISVESWYFDAMSDYDIESHVYIPEGYSLNGLYGPNIYRWRESVKAEVEPVTMMAVDPVPISVTGAEHKPLVIAYFDVVGADNSLIVKNPFASGEIGAFIEARFDKHWVGLDLCAIFRNGDEQRETEVKQEIKVNEVVSFDVPPYIVSKPYRHLCIGFCGYAKGTKERQVATAFVDLGTIPKGANCSGEAPDDPKYILLQKLSGDVGDVEKLKTSCKDNLVCAVNELVENGVGKTNNKVFDTVDAMNAWLADHSAELNVGDNLYIRQTDVPDYWWDGSAAVPLETEKIEVAEELDIGSDAEPPKGTKMQVNPNATEAVLAEVNDNIVSSEDTWSSQKIQDEIEAGSIDYPQDDPSMTHNLPRGKFLGTSVTDKQYSDIANGTFEDMYVGDYWTIEGIDWVIADINYYLNSGQNEPAGHTNHLVIIPRRVMYNARMNSSNTNSGGYVNSEMRTKNLAPAIETIERCFGKPHILLKKVRMINAVSNGTPSNGMWLSSSIDLMSERMVYGNAMMSPTKGPTPSTTDIAVSEKNQLSIFKYARGVINIVDAPYWLQDTSGELAFCCVGGAGNALAHNAASFSDGVRPCFCIG